MWSNVCTYVHRRGRCLLTSNFVTDGLPCACRAREAARRYGYFSPQLYDMKSIYWLLLMFSIFLSCDRNLFKIDTVPCVVFLSPVYHRDVSERLECSLLTNVCRKDQAKIQLWRYRKRTVWWSKNHSTNMDIAKAEIHTGYVFFFQFEQNNNQSACTCISCYCIMQHIR